MFKLPEKDFDLTSSLYIVSTPIGRITDITLTALHILSKSEVIFAEDTRVTKKLLNYYNIDTKVLSYRDQNHIRMLPIILELLNDNKIISLVSDNGTPLISDPGYKLIRYLVQNEYNIDIIPGPTALIAGLVVSGIPIDQFTFLGFLPKKGRKRTDLISLAITSNRSTILYESPYRIYKLLKEISEVNKESELFLIKDITKKFEKRYSGTVSELLSIFKPEQKLKGEWMVVIR